jgi:capsular exopolysaccharide synthesis family protein
MLNQPVGVEGKEGNIDVKEYLSVVLKRKWLILVCFLLSMALTTAFLFTRQPIYRASSKLFISVAGPSQPTSEITRESDRDFLTTQVEIMKGQPMLWRVLQRLKKAPTEIQENLANLAITAAGGGAILIISVDSPSKEFARDFSNALAEEYLKFRDEQRARDMELALLGLTREINRLGQELKAANDRVLKYVQENSLSVLTGNESLWMRTYRMNAGNLDAATRNLANAKAYKQLLESRPDPTAVIEYIKSNVPAGRPPESQPDATATLIKEGSTVEIVVADNPSLNRQLTVSANGAVNYPPLGSLTIKGLTAGEASMKLQGEMEKSGLLPPPPVSSVTSTGVAPDSLQLSQRLNRVRVMIDRGAVVASSFPAGESQSSARSSLTLGLIGVVEQGQAQELFNLEQKRISLQARLTELQKSYKSKHPAVLATQQELLDTTSQIESKIQFLKQTADARLVVMQRTYDDALKITRQLDASAINESAKQLELAALQQDAARVRSLHEILLQKLINIDVFRDFRMRNITVLEPAIVLPEPVYPKKVKGLLVAAALGLGLGLALAFFIEYIDDSIKLAEEVERDLQLPFLGMVPAAQWSPDDLTAHRLDRLKQQGGVAESYRVVRSAIIFSTPREKLRSILVSSAVPREGKTTTCVNLSIGFSQTDERVLLLDADLRRGEIHKYFEIERDKGLADVLLGEAQIEEVIKPSGVPKLDLMTCGSYPANPAELLIGWRLKEVLQWAHKHYDRVILDGPPVMGIADASILGAAVDGVLFVIWAGRTSRRYVRVAKMTAVSRGAKTFGFILNNLEPGRVGYYHYYPYYYSYYSRGYYYAHSDEDEGKGGDIKGIEVPPSGSGDKKEMDDIY